MGVATVIGAGAAAALWFAAPAAAQQPAAPEAETSGGAAIEAPAQSAGPFLSDGGGARVEDRAPGFEPAPPGQPRTGLRNLGAGRIDVESEYSADGRSQAAPGLTGEIRLPPPE